MEQHSGGVDHTRWTEGGEPLDAGSCNDRRISRAAAADVVTRLFDRIPRQGAHDGRGQRGAQPGGQPLGEGIDGGEITEAHLAQVTYAGILLS